MEYTKNYHLPQWAEEDRIMMEDFNDAMASIESGLDSKAEKSDITEMGEEIKAVLMGARQQVRDEAAAAAAPKAAVTCPNCGATTTPDASGCCEYCGGVVG